MILPRQEIHVGEPPKTIEHRQETHVGKPPKTMEKTPKIMKKKEMNQVGKSQKGHGRPWEKTLKIKQQEQIDMRCRVRLAAVFVKAVKTLNHGCILMAKKPFAIEYRNKSSRNAPRSRDGKHFESAKYGRTQIVHINHDHGM